MLKDESEATCSVYELAPVEAHHDRHGFNAEVLFETAFKPGAEGAGRAGVVAEARLEYGELPEAL